MSSFCAFGFRSDSSPNLAAWVANVIDSIEGLNHQAVVDDFSVDLEVSPGLQSFCECQQIDRLLYIDTEKRRKIGPNSQEAFYELSIFEYADRGETQLVHLLLNVATSYPGDELYLFLAFEWEANSYSRFISFKRTDLQDFFKKYYSHFYTLFDSYTGNSVLDLDTPVVVLIT
ncbi:hypothetical protein HNQ93_004325 [Hymenobacter luteus]|uniref:Uncharacterized protein n=2 Tax=Hymenobacter TaxID=89966 RepID=A0A7W9WEG0_9BACT|nr:MULTISPECIES: hypothetical protein [Hymenobacter]MBB4601506.1 hypothetical protein [Hymenobacter latericoloratus]MBB6061446.1 hypothetical protein [Hymenobacter luteus]